MEVLVGKLRYLKRNNGANHSAGRFGERPDQNADYVMNTHRSPDNKG